MAGVVATGIGALGRGASLGAKLMDGHWSEKTVSVPTDLMTLIVEDFEGVAFSGGPTKEAQKDGGALVQEP